MLPHFKLYLDRDHTFDIPRQKLTPHCFHQWMRGTEDHVGDTLPRSKHRRPLHCPRIFLFYELFLASSPQSWYPPQPPYFWDPIQVSRSSSPTHWFLPLNLNILYLAGVPSPRINLLLFQYITLWSLFYWKSCKVYLDLMYLQHKSWKKEDERNILMCGCALPPPHSPLRGPTCKITGTPLSLLFDTYFYNIWH